MNATLPKRSFLTLGFTSSLAWRKRALQVVIMVFFAVYSVVTITPFFFLFLRTFIRTQEASDLHLWIPPMEEANLNAGIGNLSVFYNLDLQKMKERFGIPVTEYLNPKWSLRQVAEKYGIPEERMQRYFAPFTRYNGWIVLFSDQRFWPSIGRTFLLTVASVIGINILSILTGTALAGLRRKDQMFVYNVFLLQAVIPTMLIILPQFMLIQWLLRRIPGYDEPGLTRHIGQLVMLVFIYVKGTALSTMIFASYISTIPRELEESATIDGASRWQYIRHILLPLMKVPIASLTVIVLPGFWNDFLQPYVYLDANNTTLLPLIQSFTGQYTTNFQVVFTGVFVSILPLVVIYLIFRGWFVRGVMAGAIKG